MGPARDSGPVGAAVVARRSASGCNGEGEGTRTLDFQRDRLNPESVSAESGARCDDASATDSTSDSNRAQEAAPDAVIGDPELADIVRAWSELPSAVRAGIVAMVRAARGDG
jgi:hypothetical protein